MLMLDRRMLLRAGSAAVGAAALAPIAPALAHAPQAGKRAQPSFYRFKLGTIEITVVSDGTLAFPPETLCGDRAEDARGLLTSTFQPPSPVGLQHCDESLRAAFAEQNLSFCRASAICLLWKRRANWRPLS